MSDYQIEKTVIARVDNEEISIELSKPTDQLTEKAMRKSNKTMFIAVVNIKPEFMAKHLKDGVRWQAAMVFNTDLLD